MGSGAFGIPTLELLAQSDFELAAVITQPDAPKGRGRKLTPTPVKSSARDLGLPVLDPAKVNDSEAVDSIRQLEPDVLIVAAYGQILRQTLLDTPRLGSFNLHASLLPAYRGVAPINWAIIDGETVTGTTVIRMDAGIDTGEIASQKATDIEPDETAGELHDRLAVEGAGLVLRTLGELDRGVLKLRAQDPAQGSYARKLTKEDGFINWAEDAMAVHNRIRGVTPWPGATTYCKGIRMRILKTAQAAQPVADADPGVLLGMGEQDGIVVSCGRGAIEIVSVQPASKRPVSGRELVSGYRLNPGEVFGT
jgi:methionyl-tRNA formyltransferase